MTQPKSLCKKFPCQAFTTPRTAMLYLHVLWLSAPGCSKNPCLPDTLGSDCNICINHLHWLINLLMAKSLLFPVKWKWEGNYSDNFSLSHDSCKWVFNHILHDIGLSKSKSSIYLSMVLNSLISVNLSFWSVKKNAEIKIAFTLMG